ncbi:MAG: hypothetical protein R2751_06805 [Bacteroidales bacterium]
MKQKIEIPDLSDSSLRKQPFAVPEGYFDTLPGAVMDRIRAMEHTEVPVRKLSRSLILRMTAAAAVAALVLVTSIFLAPRSENQTASSTDMILLEEMGLIDDDLFLMEYFESVEESLDEEEAYVNQATDYLAMNNFQTALLFE